jgi:hypothetical protein
MIENPYNKFPPEGSIPIVSKILVKSKLSNKFHEFMENMNNFDYNDNEINLRIQNNKENVLKPSKSEEKIKSLNNTKTSKISNHNKTYAKLNLLST